MPAKRSLTGGYSGLVKSGNASSIGSARVVLNAAGRGTASLRFGSAAPVPLVVAWNAQGSVLSIVQPKANLSVRLAAVAVSSKRIQLQGKITRKNVSYTVALDSDMSAVDLAALTGVYTVAVTSNTSPVQPNVDVPPLPETIATATVVAHDTGSIYVLGIYKDGKRFGQGGFLNSGGAWDYIYPDTSTQTLVSNQLVLSPGATTSISGTGHQVVLVKNSDDVVVSEGTDTPLQIVGERYVPFVAYNFQGTPWKLTTSVPNSTSFGTVEITGLNPDSRDPGTLYFSASGPHAYLGSEPRLWLLPQTGVVLGEYSVTGSGSPVLSFNFPTTTPLPTRYTLDGVVLQGQQRVVGFVRLGTDVVGSFQASTTASTVDGSIVHLDPSTIKGGIFFLLAHYPPINYVFTGNPNQGSQIFGLTYQGIAGFEMRNPLPDGISLLSVPLILANP